MTGTHRVTASAQEQESRHKRGGEGKQMAPFSLGEKWHLEPRPEWTGWRPSVGGPHLHGSGPSLCTMAGQNHKVKFPVWHWDSY